MSDLRIIEDLDSGESVYVNTGIAFGPVMATREQAEKFPEWLGGNPRQLDYLQLIAMYKTFQAVAVCRYCGAIRPDLEYEPTKKGYRYSCYDCDLASMESAKDRMEGI